MGWQAGPTTRIAPLAGRVASDSNAKKQQISPLLKRAVVTVTRKRELGERNSAVAAALSAGHDKTARPLVKCPLGRSGELLEEAHCLMMVRPLLSAESAEWEPCKRKIGSRLSLLLYAETAE